MRSVKFGVWGRKDAASKVEVFGDFIIRNGCIPVGLYLGEVGLPWDGAVSKRTRCVVGDLVEVWRGTRHPSEMGGEPDDGVVLEGTLIRAAEDAVTIGV